MFIFKEPVMYCYPTKTALPGFRDRGQLSNKIAILVNIVVAVISVIAYHSFTSFIWPVIRHPNTKLSFQTASRELRDDVEAADTPETVWDNITLSKELQWHTCYNGNQCARLEVPLDYWNGTEGTAILGIAMLPAKVSITDSRYGGPVLTNPGGPGVSGSLFTISSGSLLNTFIEPSLIESNSKTRSFDLVGIDPRGVGQSLPSARCFETDLQRSEWNIRLAAAGIPGSSNVAVADNWARRKAFSQACHQLAEDKNQIDNILPLSTTASIAETWSPSSTALENGVKQRSSGHLWAKFLSIFGIR